jgi:hypothetical protein
MISNINKVIITSRIMLMQKITRETITGAYGNHKKLFEKGGWSFKDTLGSVDVLRAV